MSIFKKKNEETIHDIFFDRYVVFLNKKCEDNDNCRREEDKYPECFPELTRDVINEYIEIYLGAPHLYECHECSKKYIESILPNPEIDWSIENLKETEEYRQHEYFNKAYWLLCDVALSVNLDTKWIELHGKEHTDEEAAKIATEKIMELCFDWHLQDNGALDEEHSFKMSALATVLGSSAKERISEDTKKKAYDLFYGYFLGYLKFVDTLEHRDFKHIDDYQNWLRENIPSNNPERYNWEYLRGELSCDYDPSWPLYLILYNAGVDEHDIHSICPWKTTIRINPNDNSVVYGTYSNVKYL